MAAYEQDIVNHYNLTTPFPTEWPAELDDSDAEDQSQALGLTARRSKSRYSALERSTSDRRSVVPGSQKTGDGRANLVQKDEPDPLGGPNTVVKILQNKGLPVEEDTRLRNKFLLSSTTFSPPLFLSQAHSNASTDALLQGLDYLTQSIDQKSASLKVLVESNFDRFVRAKATIDNVYTEMRSHGAQSINPNSRPQSRHVSRQSGHFRNFSGGSGIYNPTALQPPPKKNALVKESDYGVLGIKAPLLDITQKAEDVWGPALGGREREQQLKSVTEAMEHDRALYEIGANLTKQIKQKDYEAVVETYNLARKHTKEAQALAEKATNGRQQLSDRQIHQILITGRMWSDVDEQVKMLKREIWKRLSNIQTVLSQSGNANAEEHMELIGVLLELGVEDNPIWVWLLSRYDYLKNKITATSERSKIEIEIVRRRLTTGEKPTPQTTAIFLKQAVKENTAERIDTDAVIEMWELVLSFLTRLLSVQNGLLGEVTDFWETTESFIAGDKQKLLPTGFEGTSRHHHRLSDAGVRDLQNGAVELINMIRESVFMLFADPPIEDISALFSPMPPNTPKTPLSGLLSPADPRFGNLDPATVPPPSPKQGEAWEEYAFWPPYSNCLSAVDYLSKILVLLGTAASEMAAIKPVRTGSNSYEKVKGLITASRERCVRAICAAWNKDAEYCRNIEDWTRSAEQRDLTKMPMYFMSFEKAVLQGLQKILYISEASTRPDTGDVISPPPSKLLQMVRTQFVTSIYKSLSGMVENAEKPVKVEEDEWVVVTKSLAIDAQGGGADKPAVVADAVDASSRNVRMLLTLSNLKALRINFVPELIALFESSFSVKLTDESKTIRDVLGQIDARLFQSYTSPIITNLSGIIQTGISSPDWVPKVEKPNQVRPYVYNVMLTLVMVHTEVTTTSSIPSSSTSSPPTSLALTNEILSHLLESISSSLLKAFSTYHPSYSLPALMQATLDVEFIAQTLSQYATDKASKIQSQIYLELDRRTDNNARVSLQSELGEMRGSLKKLREGSRGVYACFRRERATRERRPERKPTEYGVE